MEPPPAFPGECMSLSTDILNSLHKSGFTLLNCALCELAYRFKGFGPVEVRYHPEFRAYSYRVRGQVFLSRGPGWAYSANYLLRQLEETYCYRYLPKVGDTVIDIGAGLGEEASVFAQLVGSAGKVIAIEANPYTYGGLKYLCDENHYTWMKPFHKAVYKEAGIISIEDDANDYVKNTIHLDGNAQAGIQVEATTVDQVAKENEIKQIDFLKCNIEGAEQFLVQSMKDSIQMTRNVCISCHDWRHDVYRQGEFYVTRKLIEDFLNDHGFEIFAGRKTGNLAIDGGVYARNLKLA